MAHAATCSQTGFVRDNINLTAAQIGGDVTGSLDATTSTLRLATRSAGCRSTTLPTGTDRLEPALTATSEGDHWADTFDMLTMVLLALAVVKA